MKSSFNSLTAILGAAALTLFLFPLLTPRVEVPAAGSESHQLES